MGTECHYMVIILISSLSEQVKGPLLAPFQAVQKAEGVACGFMCVGHYELLV